MLRSFRVHQFLVCLLVLPLLGACDGLRGGMANAEAARVSLGAETPEELIERVQEATADRDVVELAACLEREARAELAQGLYMTTAMVVAFSGMAETMGQAMGEALGAEVTEKPEGGLDPAKLTEDFNAIAREYGLPSTEDEPEDEPEGSPDEIFGGMDDRKLLGLIGALGDLMDGLGEETGGGTDVLPSGPLQSIDVDGDTAVAHFGEETADLVRVEDRWFLKGSPLGDMMSGADDTSGASPTGLFGGPGDATPTTLSVGATQRAEVAPSMDFSGTWFRLSPGTETTVTVTVIGLDGAEESNDFVLEGYLDGEYMEPAARSDADIEGNRTNESFDLEVPAGSQLDVKVRLFGGGADVAAVPFQISVTAN
jgi:hypothetical protein